MRQIGSDPVSGGDLGEFFANQGQSLLRFAYLLTAGQRAEAEDLVQTVLARLMARGLEDLDDPLAYARRGIVNEHRSLGRHAAVVRKVLPRLATERDGEAGVETEDRLTVLDALSALTDRERAVIVLRYYEDLPDLEIASIVGCSRPTVRSLTHRAMPKLQARLSETYGPSGACASDSPERSGHDD